VPAPKSLRLGVEWMNWGVSSRSVMHDVCLEAGQGCLNSIPITGVCIFMGLGSGNDRFAIGMVTIGGVIEKPGMFAIGRGMHKTMNHARPQRRFGAANGGIGQLPNRIVFRSSHHERFEDRLFQWICKTRIAAFRDGCRTARGVEPNAVWVDSTTQRVASRKRPIQSPKSCNLRK